MTERNQNQDDLVPRRWNKAIHWFQWYVRRFIPKNFHALRISKGCEPQDPGNGPLIFLLNHPSWWDPLIGIALTALFPNRQAFSPMDSAGLAKYKFFSWLGFYGVDIGTTRGAATFLRTSRSILQNPDAMLWITAQGQFTDPRKRPVTLRNGIGHLAARVDHGHVIPLALEYPFWNERFPEALVRFGEPIPIGKAMNLSPAEWTIRFTQSLEKTMDALASEAIHRDPDLFNTFLAGKTGIGGFYDLWRGLKALLKGKQFHAGHGFLKQDDQP